MAGPLQNHEKNLLDKNKGGGTMRDGWRESGQWHDLSDSLELMWERTPCPAGEVIGDTFSFVLRA